MTSVRDYSKDIPAAQKSVDYYKMKEAAGIPPKADWDTLAFAEKTYALVQCGVMNHQQYVLAYENWIKKNLRLCPKWLCEN